MSYRILDNPNVPNDLKAVYATQVVEAAEARMKRYQEEYEARQLKEAQIKETLEQFQAEAMKREAKAEREKKERATSEAVEHEYKKLSADYRYQII